MTRTFCAVHPGRRVERRVGGGVGVEAGGDGRAAQLVNGAPGVDLPDDRGAGGVQDEPGFGAALRGLDRDGVRDPLGGVAVGGGADVPAVEGMLDEAFPDLFLELEPVPFRDGLLDPPDQDGGGVDALDVGGLVGGEQRDSLPGQLLFEFQGVEHVPAGPLDVLADDGGEPGLRAGGFGEQVGHAAVAGQPGAGGLLPGVCRGRAVRGPGRRIRCPSSTATMCQPGGSQSWQERICRRIDAAGSCSARVEVRARTATGISSAGTAWSSVAGGRQVCGCWLSHCSTSMMTAACRASISRPRFPVAILILYRTFIPSGLCSSLKL